MSESTPPDGLTAEQQEQVQQALTRAKTAFKGVSRAGILGLLVRGMFKRLFRLPRFSKRKIAFFGIGLVVLVLSVATCSAGVNLTSLTAEYGEPVPATTEAARRFAERTATAIQNAPANRRFRISISETEATSALSLGLLTPELMQAMEAMPPDEIQQFTDIGELRTAIREREEAARETRTFPQKIAGLFDPRLRTGDVQVRFTGQGEIVVAGYVQAWRFQQPVLVVFAPRAASGELELDFVKGQVGRLPAPAPAFDLLGQLAASLILQGRDYAEISRLQVEQGRLTFEASVTQ